MDKIADTRLNAWINLLVSGDSEMKKQLVEAFFQKPIDGMMKEPENLRVNYGSER